VWKGAVRLEPGTYHYKFLLDGHWHDDPECTLRISNSFGTEDNGKGSCTCMKPANGVICTGTHGGGSHLMCAGAVSRAL
jgi:hypothetical protein